ncbi:MAG: hypothetical protein J6X49_05115 [Victivallales bacterium]|nr:hypothetical protein [Victivallales bacterium]
MPSQGGKLDGVAPAVFCEEPRRGLFDAVEDGAVQERDFESLADVVGGRKLAFLCE